MMTFWKLVLTMSSMKYVVDKLNTSFTDSGHFVLLDETGWRIKIVERAGTKIMDILHKSDPWQGEDCERDKCSLCSMKIILGKPDRQDWKKRCIVY